MAYCTTAQVKAYAGINEPDDDELITNLITRSQAIIDAHCRRTFESTTTASRYYTVGADTEGAYRLWLDEDLASITQVLNGDSSQTEITASQYTTVPKNDTPYYGIRILRSASKVWEYDEDPEDAITVTGYWAYSTTAPADIVHACIRLATFLYRQKDTSIDTDRALITDSGVTILPTSLPHDVQQLLAPYRRH
jgi:hypothetical protein